MTPAGGAGPRYARGAGSPIVQFRRTEERRLFRPPLRVAASVGVLLLFAAGTAWLAPAFRLGLSAPGVAATSGSDGGARAAATTPAAPARAGGAAPGPEVAGAGHSWRAVWVPADHLVTAARRERVVRDAIELGATDLLVQVRCRGDALYRTAYAPASRALTAREGPATISLKEDPLWRMLDLARARGLRIHAWFNVFVAWSAAGAPPDGHALHDHPEWAIRLADGRSTLTLTPSERKAAGLEGAFLSPGSVEVRRHLVELVEELARFYPLDGIHFDYVRYPSAACVDPGEALPILSREPDSLRVRRQADAVTAFVREASAAARSARPGILVTAAVFPEPRDARRDVRQDWVRWLREGWIDRAVPMAYTESPLRLEDWRRRWELAGADLSRVSAGLAVYRNSTSALCGQAEWAATRVPGGVALFALEHLQEERGRLRAVRAALDRAPAPVPAPAPAPTPAPAPALAPALAPASGQSTNSQENRIEGRNGQDDSGLQ